MRLLLTNPLVISTIETDSFSKIAEEEHGKKRTCFGF